MPPPSKTYAAPIIFPANKADAPPSGRTPGPWRANMLDIVMLAGGLGCFALLVLYGIASERL